MTRKRTIIINSDDVPTIKRLVDTISRLRKDYKLLSKMRGSKDTEEPESFKSVISFLEMLIKREKRNIRKEGDFIDDSMQVMINLVGEHLAEMDDWELKRTFEETSLNKILGKIKDG